MSTKNQKSRDADKFVLRFPENMRERVNKRAEKEFISMNAFMIQAIAEKLDNMHRMELVLGALDLALLKASIGELSAPGLAHRGVGQREEQQALDLN